MLALSDQVLLSITGVVGTAVSSLGLIVLAYIAYLTAKTNKNQEEVKKVLEINTTKQDEKLQEIGKVTNETRTWVNSLMGVQLELNVVTTSRLANITKDPADIQSKERAVSMLKEHKEHQQKVDEKKNLDAEAGTSIGIPANDNAIQKIQRDIAAVPEKTAQKVVDKIAKDKP